MLDKLDAALQFNQSVLRIRSQRQELIAANIANADTPNYKARDIDFKAAMQQALSQQPSKTTSNHGLTQSANAHLDGNKPMNNSSAGPNEPLFRPVMQGSVDGNTVDMDIERNQFLDNAIRYEAGLNAINGQIKKMLAAIQGQ